MNEHQDESKGMAAPGTPQRRGWRMAAWLARIAIAGAILALIIRKCDMAAFQGAFARVRLGWFGLSLAAYMGYFVVWAIRYGALLETYSVASPFWWRLRAVLTANCVTMALPGGWSGDVVRYLGGRRRRMPALPVFSVVILEKVLTFWAWCVLPLLAAGFVWGDTMVRWSAALFAAMAAAGIACFAARSFIFAMLRRVATAIRMAGLCEKLDRLNDALDHSRSKKRLWAISILQTFVFEILICLAAYLAGVSAGLAVSPAHYVFMIALVYFINTVPVTPGGIGVREGIIVGYLLHLGVAREIGLVYGVLILAMNMLAVLVGAIVFAARGIE